MYQICCTLCVETETRLRGTRGVLSPSYVDADPGYMSSEIRNFIADISIRETNESFDGLRFSLKVNFSSKFPAVYMSDMMQNLRLFHVSNLPVLNFRSFLLMYPGSQLAVITSRHQQCPVMLDLKRYPLRTDGEEITRQHGQQSRF